ncbi:type 2 isopentenyl-diphosphate Delta-isomerase [Borreliella burgdorferi]|uniref:type 2 isopentenyl-diphosphate Delta-isomerase n=1 Tax=Borreliella burgdorferi TaxID=139 RepID=UPI0001F23ABA|nr:type 2 isopentenyl-diphosphate Delta-isomerase [Borreliella burgdorferi]ADQ29670.1 isopentenyl-diphosphate delta-isomerase, type 2 [Borreliella burgdorferi N40]MCD2413106.1 type 2 isopentenyl-diphosphate Delta-isomerase [Borreliella burgdorferi]PRQ91206.1 type 2 isopentenyl-diphosphate Delta-isomerase [Borreliella burgdorferi]PRR15600.1 type 2 isopentenyl-diphosphate Delta-isomerase [Borreliella burgdorferi]PRR16812.1 type 2 isopentenyl-diphosphate Delta-isomerase [Borreliella burgdorferi]
MGIEPNILENKKRHIEICLNKNDVKSSCNFLKFIKLKHNALSDFNFSEISIKEEIFGYNISMPVFISSMTGGSKEGNDFNKSLVRIANYLKIPMGLGSFKLLFKYPEYIRDFTLKRYAHNIPLFANVGAVQIVEFGISKIAEMIKRLEVDAIIVHLNAGQELMKIDGDRNFKGIRESIAKLSDFLSVPLIVKETGFGISPKDVKELFSLGVSYIDLAGSGGTNWVLVEGMKGNNLNIASCFSDWGIPSIFTLLSVDDSLKANIFASGGYETGMDIAKGIALGARLIGVAAVVLRAFYDSGEDAVFNLFSDYEHVLKMSMFLSGSKSLSELRNDKYFLSSYLLDELGVFKQFYGT